MQKYVIVFLVKVFTCLLFLILNICLKEGEDNKIHVQQDFQLSKRIQQGVIKFKKLSHFMQLVCCVHKLLISLVK